MEQEDDRRIRRPRFAVEHMNPVSFNAMVRRQRNIRNVSHRLLSRNVWLLIEIEQSDLATKSVEAHNGGCEETAAIKAQGLPSLCCRWLRHRRRGQYRLVQTALRPAAASVDAAPRVLLPYEECARDWNARLPSTAAAE